MSQTEWPHGDHPVESADGRNSNPPVKRFFYDWTNQALGELKLWIEQEFDLRPAGASGDYVFLEEQIVTVTDTPIVFTDIDQSYSHLVIEASLQSYDDAGPTGMNLSIEYAAGVVGHANLFNAADTVVPDADRNNSEVKAFADWALSARNETDVPASSNYALATIKFPYYALTDRFKGCLWQATAWRNLEEDDGTMGVTYVTGGSMQAADDADSTKVAVTEITLGEESGLVIGSRASLYGIRIR